MQHFIQYDSQCPYVAFLRVCIFFIGLRGHVLWRSYVVINLRPVWYAFLGTVPEIYKANFLGYAILPIGPLFVSKDDIIGLDVTMNYALVFDCLVSLKHFHQDIEKDLANLGNSDPKSYIEKLCEHIKNKNHANLLSKLSRLNSSLDTINDIFSEVLVYA